MNKTRNLHKHRSCFHQPKSGLEKFCIALADGAGKAARQLARWVNKGFGSLFRPQQRRMDQYAFDRYAGIHKKWHPKTPPPDWAGLQPYSKIIDQRVTELASGTGVPIQLLSFDGKPQVKSLKVSEITQKAVSNRGNRNV
jgi:hypothetical protein